MNFQNVTLEKVGCSDQKNNNKLKIENISNKFLLLLVS